MPTPQEQANYDKFMDDMKQVADAALAAGWFEGNGILKPVEMIQRDVAYEDAIFSAEFITLSVEAAGYVKHEKSDEAKALYSRTSSMESDTERDAIRNYLTLHFAKADGKNKVDFKLVDMVEAALDQVDKTIVNARKGKTK